MRVRTIVFGLVCGSASMALAQDGGYVRFPAISSQACASACASDRMCASWSYGSSARSYGQNGGGMCTFSASSVVRNAPGQVSGLPPRETAGPMVPMVSAPPRANNQSFPAQSYSPAPPINSGASGWDVRPAPWLNNSGEAPQIMAPMPSTGTPQVLRPVPPIPSPTPSTGPRIEFEPAAPPPQQTYTRPPMAQPMMAPPPAPVYAPAPIQPAYVPPTYSPPPIAPVAPSVPVPPPGTREMPQGTYVPVSPAVAPVATPPPSPRRRPARGTPKARKAAPAPWTPPVEAAAPFTESPAPEAMTAPSSEAAPARRPPPPPARGTPRSTTQPVAAANPTTAAPPRQETSVRPTTGRTTRPPVRDPNDPESFRGADGMIDAAEMRRAQLNAARDQGTPAYSVQREWEAVESERQRAEAAGEERVDPLAGTVPVPPPPETRAERRAREAEEAAATAAQAAEEARAAIGSSPDPAASATPTRRPASRGARGVPRPKTPRPQASRPAPPQALDREPRLSGGPG